MKIDITVTSARLATITLEMFPGFGFSFEVGKDEVIRLAELSDHAWQEMEVIEDSHPDPERLAEEADMRALRGQ